MRKTATITASGGRDAGKTFLITEMPASQAERWAMRAFLALAKSGADIPENVANAGMASIADVGFKALSGLSFEDAQPLLDEMFTCVQMIPDPARPNVVRRLIEDDIEKVATRLQLRSEVFKLHVGFSPAVAPLMPTSAAATVGSSNT